MLHCKALFTVQITVCEGGTRTQNGPILLISSRLQTAGNDDDGYEWTTPSTHLHSLSSYRAYGAMFIIVVSRLPEVFTTEEKLPL